jgi:hypothetical protein
LRFELWMRKPAQFAGTGLASDRRAGGVAFCLLLFRSPSARSQQLALGEP